LLLVCWAAVLVLSVSEFLRNPYDRLTPGDASRGLHWIALSFGAAVPQRPMIVKPTTAEIGLEPNLLQIRSEAFYRIFSVRPLR
jgi:hypothetical protein